MSYGGRISNANAIGIWSDPKYQFFLGVYSITFSSSFSVTKVRSIMFRRSLDLQIITSARVIYVKSALFMSSTSVSPSG